MTDKELADKITKNIDLDNISNKINEWGGMLSEEEKKELFDKGGVL